MKKTKTIITIVSSILILILMCGMVGTLFKKSNKATETFGEYMDLATNRYAQNSAIIDYSKYVMLPENIVLPEQNLLFYDVSENTKLSNGIKLDFSNKYKESIDFKIAWNSSSAEYVKENNVKDFVTIKKDLFNKKAVTIKAIDYFAEQIKLSIINKKTKAEIASFTIDMVINNDYSDSSKFDMYDNNALMNLEKVAFKNNKFFVIKYDNKYEIKDDTVFKKGTVGMASVTEGYNSDIEVKMFLSDELVSYIKSNNLNLLINQYKNFQQGRYDGISYTSLDLVNMIFNEELVKNSTHTELLQTLYNMLSDEKLADIPHLKLIKFNFSEFTSCTTELNVRIDLEQIKKDITPIAV